MGLPAGWPLHADYEDSFQGVFQLLLSWNLIMGTFNLLPVFPMDGGRIFRALLAWKLSYVDATRSAVMVGRVLSVSFALLAFFYFNRPLVGCLFAFIFMAGNAEYRNLLRREREAAYWEEVARRIAAHPPSASEPPLIGHGQN